MRLLHGPLTFAAIALAGSSCVGVRLPQPNLASSPSDTSLPPTKQVATASALPTSHPDGEDSTPPGAIATLLSSTLPVCRQAATVGLDQLQLAFNAEWDGDNEVYTVRADGSALTQLTENVTEDVNPVWSPDGEQIAFVADIWNPRLYVAQADGSGGRIVRPDFEITSLQVGWSPRAGDVVFRNMVDLYMMNTTNGELTLLTGGAHIGPGIPTFSPDGAMLAFAAGVPGRTDNGLFAVKADGTGLTELAFLEGHTIGLTTWRPQSDQILFEASAPSEGTRLYLATLDGSITMLPIDTASSGSVGSSWSQDGSMLGYLTGTARIDSQGTVISRDSLHIATPDGEVDVAVILPPADPDADLSISELVWAPDGRHIAYSINTKVEGVDLYVLDICDGSSRLVVEAIDFYSAPSWRPLP